MHFPRLQSSERPDTKKNATIRKLVVVVGTVLIASPFDGNAQVTRADDTMHPKHVSQVLQDRRSEILAIPGVVGVAEGMHNGRPCITVYVTRKTRALMAKIPDVIDGYPVTVIQSGVITPRLKRQRPP